MSSDPLLSLSPLDGRYQQQTANLAQYFCEANLIQQRLNVELLYLQQLSQAKIIRSLTKKEQQQLRKLQKFNLDHAQQIKKIEAEIHHDVKAVEYFLRQQFTKTSLEDLIPWLHFGLTSEDINNLALRSMLQPALQKEIFPTLEKTLTKLADFAQQQASLPMLARTHGQPAIPTILGKELAVFLNRLTPLFIKLKNFQFQGKCSGAVGGYHTFALTFPDQDWQKFFSKFIQSLNLQPLTISTQINPQDDLVECCHLLHHLNAIFIGLNQDMWHYISDNWLQQKTVKNAVGSSTMPQKINPIQFENSEGNLKLANGLLSVFFKELPISRLQRDLSDSTVRRNLGVALGHCLLAYKNLTKGLGRISPNQQKISQALNNNWTILAEAAQTVARQNGDDQAYEKIAQATKNKTMTKKDWQKLAQQIDPEKLKDLTPETYLGYSEKLTKQTIDQFKKLILKESKS